jgi:hypothetical protein
VEISRLAGAVTIREKLLTINSQPCQSAPRASLIEQKIPREIKPFFLRENAVDGMALAGFSVRAIRKEV